jgi:hypothetical protein
LGETRAEAKRKTKTRRKKNKREGNEKFKNKKNEKKKIKENIDCLCFFVVSLVFFPLKF